MRVLVACEFSGIVRDAFLAQGHDAWSCDLLPTERPGLHVQGDVRAILYCGWDLLVAHPPCRYLARSGARWWPDKQPEQQDALLFVAQLYGAPIKRIALENPVGIISRYAKPTQIIQPYQFGHGETKTTCLWLKGLPRLRPTLTVRGRSERVYQVPERAYRWMDRSRTLPGIAVAMAAQWGNN